MRELSVIRKQGHTEEIHHAQYNWGASGTDSQTVSDADGLRNDSERNAASNYSIE